jgi:predicted metal-binding membrane protein
MAALLWSASPWQRAALNRGHRLARISLFGWAAARDCVRFGVVHGGWCVASCWPWMLAAMVAKDWHLPFMVAAGAIMLGERLAQPNRPRWHWPVLLTALDPRTNLAPLVGMLRHG